MNQLVQRAMKLWTASPGVADNADAASDAADSLIWLPISAVMWNQLDAIVTIFWNCVCPDSDTSKFMFGPRAITILDGNYGDPRFDPWS